MSSHQIVEHRIPDRNGAEHLLMMHTLFVAHRSWRIPTTSCCALARGQEKRASETFWMLSAQCGRYKAHGSACAISDDPTEAVHVNR